MAAISAAIRRAARPKSASASTRATAAPRMPASAPGGAGSGRAVRQATLEPPHADQRAD
jgi:hypothetical protein